MISMRQNADGNRDVIDCGTGPNGWNGTVAGTAAKVNHADGKWTEVRFVIKNCRCSYNRVIK